MKTLVIFLILSIINCLPVILFSMENSPLAQDNKKSSYSLLGAGREFSYFFSPNTALPSTYILLKVPLNNSLGIETAYCYYKKPSASYTTGPNTYKQMNGTEEFNEARLNFLYYFWFFKHLQFKAGINYSQFIRGDFPVDASLTQDGMIININKYIKKNFFSLNFGFNLDRPLYKNLYIITSFGYRCFFTDDTAKKGALNFGMGLGMMFNPFTMKKENEQIETGVKSGPEKEKRRVEKRTEEKTEAVKKADIKKESSEKLKDKQEAKKKSMEKAKEEAEKKIKKDDKTNTKEEAEKKAKEDADAKQKAMEAAEKKIEEDKKIKEENEKKLALLKKPESDISKIDITADKEQFSPLNTKVNFSVSADTSNRIQQWGLLLAKKEETNNILKVIQGTNALPNLITWDGKGMDSRLLKDGTYNYQMEVKFQNELSGRTPPKTIKLNTKPPEIKVKNSYSLFSPDNDGFRDTISFYPELFDTIKIKEWKLIIKDSKDDKIIKEFKGEDIPDKEIVWNGADNEGGILPEKTKLKYTFYAKNILDNENESIKYFIETDYYLTKTNNGLIINDIRPIEFDLDKSSIKPEDYILLDKAAEILNSPNIINRKVRIEGHTDNSGAEIRNTALSRERAQVVIDYLIQKRINSARLIVETYGSARPIAPNNTEEGKRKNRRAEIIIINE